MNIVERAKSLLVSPRPTWEVIDAEVTDTARLYTGYLMILAAIPAVCGFIGMSLIGMGGFGITFRVPVMAGLANMLVSYVLSLVGVFLLALIIDALAPRFGGVSNRVQAVKVAVYSSTAAMLGGIFTLLPMLSILGLVAAAYSIYLLYTGLPIVMKSGREKSAGYTAIVIVAAILLGMIVGAIGSMFVSRGAGMMSMGDAGSVEIRSPDGKVVLDAAAIAAAQQQLEQATRKIEAANGNKDAQAMAAASMEASKAAGKTLGLNSKVLDTNILKAALPEQLGGMARTAYEAQDGSTIGVAASQVTAEYGTGMRAVHLEISDLGGLGAMAAAAFGMVQGEKEDQTHMEKTWQEDGRTFHESYMKDKSSAERRVALKNGIMVTLTAENTDIATLRDMALQVNLSALEQLSRPAS